MVRSARRGRWQRRRLIAWDAGLAATAGRTGPLSGQGNFRAHVAGHLPLGMLALLLCWLAAPLTSSHSGDVALDAMPAGATSRWTRCRRDLGGAVARRQPHDAPE